MPRNERSAVKTTTMKVDIKQKENTMLKTILTTAVLSFVPPPLLADDVSTFDSNEMKRQAVVMIASEMREQRKQISEEFSNITFRIDNSELEQLAKRNTLAHQNRLFGLFSDD
jgi:uncharacterized protein with HEPN domain